MSQDPNTQDPLDFIRGMWSSMGFSLPGMVTPTVDIEELDKRITDMKAVENWLKMNLNMLQMSIQGLEMQRATIAAVKAMSAHVKEGESPASDSNPFAAAAGWPWSLMNAQQGQGTAGTDTSPPARSTRRKPAADK